MPIYEYNCPKCGDFEVTQRISEEALKNCPTCRRKVKKLISQTSFQLKGSGWYVTDYARKGNGAADGKGSESGKRESSSSEAPASSESKLTSKETKAQKAA